MTLRPLSNRAGKFEMPGDGWYHVVPLGEYPHESGVVQVVDKVAIESMVNRFTPSVLVDFDHFSYDPDKSSEAAAWGDEVEARADGLWSKLRLTDVGEPALKNGRFRFISPVWRPEDVEDLGDGRIRPLRLDTLGLTNNPNMRGMVPLSNREALPASPAQPTPPARESQADNQTQMKSIAIKLGLSADASEASVLAEVEKLIKRCETAESSAGTATKERDEAVVANRRLAEEQIDADLTIAGITDEGKIGRLKPILAAMKNRKERTDFLADFAPVKDATKTGVQQPLTNRETAKTPATKPGDETAVKAASAQRAARISNRAGQLRTANPRLSVGESYNRAEQELSSEEAAK